MELRKEIEKRRTFAIISHPDAGKTTLTEKLLLFGGAIQTAGAVKSNKAKHHASSDFMEIEKQRGISVATSVMGFEYQGCKINLLDTFIKIAPPPGRKETTLRTIIPDENKFSGFIFKIHANLDPKHRDRLAFLRVCSGKFKRHQFYHHVRLGKNLRFSNPYSFMANEKNITEDALPGDVVGLYDTGNFKIGDTLTEGEPLMFRGIPSFSPEIFKEEINTDPIKTKQLDKGIRQLTDEGVAQLFIKQPGNRKIIGTVGSLQFDVIQFRLENEYNAKCRFHPLQLYKACWVEAENEEALQAFLKRKATDIAWDKDGRPVFLAASRSVLNMVIDYYPDLQFHFLSEKNLESITK